MATTLNDGTRVVLHGKKVCPNCGKEKPLAEFGARRMKPKPNGKVTNQSWCSSCR